MLLFQLTYVANSILSLSLSLSLSVSLSLCLCLCLSLSLSLSLCLSLSLSLSVLIRDYVHISREIAFTGDLAEPLNVVLVDDKTVEPLREEYFFVQLDTAPGESSRIMVDSMRANITIVDDDSMFQRLNKEQTLSLPPSPSPSLPPPPSLSLSLSLSISGCIWSGKAKLHCQ